MTTKRLNLAKAGFVRRPDWDFSDDGSYFRCYEYKGLRISVCKWKDTYYVAVASDSRSDVKKPLFTWYDWSKTEAYKLQDEFNGCTEVDVDKLVQNCEVILKTIDELNAKVVNDKIDFTGVLSRANVEYDMCKKLIDTAKNDFAWWSASKYDLSDVVRAIGYLETDMEQLEKVMFGTMDTLQARQTAQSFEQYGYVKVRDDDYSKRKIEELVAKYRRG